MYNRDLENYLNLFDLLGFSRSEIVDLIEKNRDPLTDQLDQNEAIKALDLLWIQPYLQ